MKKESLNKGLAKELLNFYFYTLDRKPIRQPDKDKTNDEDKILNHCAWMLQIMLTMIDDEWPEGKFFRWLGFVQGCLFTYGIRSIDEMMQDNIKILGKEGLND